MKVINQTSQAANGRRVALSVVDQYTGTATTDAMENGQTSIITATVTGVLLGGNNDIIITNGNILPANVFVTSKEVTANNTVTLTVENQSGNPVASFVLNVKVLSL